MNHRWLCALIMGTLAAGSALPQTFPTDLQKYLNLSDPQVKSIADLNQQFNQSVSQQSGLLYQLQAQAQQELQKDSPDPGVVGDAYAKIEMMKRDYFAQEASLQSKVAAVLTADQTVLVSALVAVERLQPLVMQAQNSCLVPQPAPVGVVNISSGTQIYCSVNPVPTALSNYLGLTDAQAIAMQGAASSYSSYLAHENLEMWELQQQIRDLTAAPVIDANQLGAAYVALANIFRDEYNQSSEMAKTIRSIATEQQKPLLKALEDAIAPHAVALQAECYNILVVPPDLTSRSNYYCYSYSPFSR